MRALQVLELGGPDAVQLRDVPERESDTGVIVETRAVGLSFPDLLRSRGQYREKTTPPYTVGAEVAGIVVSAPAGSGFSEGDRVAGMASGAAAQRRF